MTTSPIARILLGIALGLVLGSLPLLHARSGGGHDHAAASHGHSHAPHTH
jgi:hypothetical protein